MCPLQCTVNSGFIISFSKADNATIGLIVDPGEYLPLIVLFTKGFIGLFLINCQSSWLMPNKNKLGLKEGDDCIAITSPEKISITHIEPALSFNN